MTETKFLWYDSWNQTIINGKDDRDIEMIAFNTEREANNALRDYLRQHLGDTLTLNQLEGLVMLKGELTMTYAEEVAPEIIEEMVAEDIDTCSE